jgi:V/A-type H+/Na+-transporting ATPase subunit D
MNPSEIAPTKTNLFEYKAQLIFSIDGHSLLEEKREVLVMHLMEIISEIRKHREKLNSLLQESYGLLRVVSVELGELELHKIVQVQKAFSEVTVMEKSIMGVNIPTIKYKEKDEAANRIGMSFYSTNSDYDRLIQNVREIMRLIVTVTQVEASAWRLAYEIKKTQRKVNALENVFIPDFKEIIKFIQDTLEERERETFFQMKRVKNAHEQAEEE